MRLRKKYGEQAFRRMSRPKGPLGPGENPNAMPLGKGDANSVPIGVGEGMSDANLVPIGQKVSQRVFFSVSMDINGILGIGGGTVSWQGPTLKHGCIWYHSHGGDANSVPIGGGGRGCFGRQFGSYWSNSEATGFPSCVH